MSKKDYIIEETSKSWKTKFIDIEFNKGLNCLEVVWKNWASEEQFMEILHKEIEIIENHPTPNIFIDALEFKGTTPNIQNWVESEWSELAYNAGLRNYAIVVSQDIFSAFSVQMVMGEKFFSFLNAEKFDNEKDAREWLKQYA